MFSSTEQEIQALDQQSQASFYSRYNNERKDPTAGILLCLFTGGIGGHEFYLGNIGVGIIYLIFCWTFIPIIIAFFQLFTIQPRIMRMNDKLAKNILAGIKDVQPAESHPLGSTSTIENAESELKKLSDMRSKGTITEAEYQALRKKTLGL